jgi:hypothetical protein
MKTKRRINPKQRKKSTRCLRRMIMKKTPRCPRRMIIHHPNSPQDWKILTMMTSPEIEGVATIGQTGQECPRATKKRLKLKLIRNMVLERITDCSKTKNHQNTPQGTIQIVLKTIWHNLNN